MKKWFVVVITVLISIIVAGCTQKQSNIAIPSQSLQEEALDEIKAYYREIRYKSIRFVSDSYDSNNFTYTMVYEVDYQPWNGLSWDIRTIKACSQYDKKKEAWEKVSYYTTDDKRYPNDKIVGTHIKNREDNRGFLSVDILGFNNESVDIRINANQYAVGEHILNIDYDHLSCPYKFYLDSSVWGKPEYMEIKMGTYDHSEFSLMLEADAKSVYDYGISGEYLNPVKCFCRINAYGEGKEKGTVIADWSLERVLE